MRLSEGYEETIGRVLTNQGSDDRSNHPLGGPAGRSYPVPWPLRPLRCTFGKAARMAKEIDLTDPDALLEYAVIQVLADQYPEVQTIHATLFILAAEGGYTFEEAVAETGESDATLRAAFNDLRDRGLVQDTSPWDLTNQGDKLSDDAFEAVRELLRKRIEH